MHVVALCFSLTTHIRAWVDFSATVSVITPRAFTGLPRQEAPTLHTSLMVASAGALWHAAALCLMSANTYHNGVTIPASIILMTQARHRIASYIWIMFQNSIALQDLLARSPLETLSRYSISGRTAHNYTVTW